MSPPISVVSSNHSSNSSRSFDHCRVIADRGSFSDEPEDLPLSVVYEDGELIVVDKPVRLPACSSERERVLIMRERACPEHCPARRGCPVALGAGREQLRSTAARHAFLCAAHTAAAERGLTVTCLLLRGSFLCVARTAVAV